MSLPNAYCKKHDEIEPQDNEEFWVCPKCSQENNKLTKRLPCGRKPLDVALVAALIKIKMRTK